VDNARDQKPPQAGVEVVPIEQDPAIEIDVTITVKPTNTLVRNRAQPFWNHSTV
jgi:hypothetical protein